MQDNIMYIWNVVSEQHGVTLWSSARKEIAEYMRDWENASVENSIRDLEKSYPSIDWTRSRLYAESFVIQEGEVIL